MQKMLAVDIWTIARTKEGSAVLLRPRNKNVAVPIFVGQLEIQSIIIGKEGVQLPRPLTHDLFLNLLGSQNLTLDRAEIHELKKNTFHARLVIHGGNYGAQNPLLMDCRPSDALGLSVRSKCPILISSEIVKQTGIPLDLFTEILENNASKSANKLSRFELKRRKLQKQLNDAVECEDYEQAAGIRDKLKDLEASANDGEEDVITSF